MAKILTEKIGCFNPILRPFFTCPVCGGDRFVYLTPLAGLWCEKCNAEIEVGGTCDGLRKVSVQVSSKSCHDKRWRELFDRASTVIWEDDGSIKWIFAKDHKMFYDIEPIR
uniref:Uncharacterized protein n=1 Tax=viral metagenome TaxID=1070528 RepID=A0A6M3LYX1_9ZZZZ